MTYELITPEKAQALLDTNCENRKISQGTVEAYASDIISGNWDETTGVAISIDEDGTLRDGQHRCAAVVQAGKGIWTWVCRNVSSDGIYDNNRKRSNPDQISILRPDLDGVYRSPRYISIARAIILHNAKNGNRVVSPKEILSFTDTHKEDLDGFFLNLPQNTIPKISLATVHLALFMAYMSGIDIEDILNYYDVLCSGMSTGPIEFPIIAYRNYLLNTQLRTSNSPEEISRCQYSIKKYLTKACTKRTCAVKDFYYPFPWGGGKDE